MELVLQYKNKMGCGTHVSSKGKEFESIVG